VVETIKEIKKKRQSEKAAFLVKKSITPLTYLHKYAILKTVKEE